VIQRAVLVGVAGRLIKSAHGFAIAKKYDLGVEEDDLFDAMVAKGHAQSREQAVKMAGVAFPPIGGGTWMELAAWVAEYEAMEHEMLSAQIKKNTIKELAHA
jgi:hypothetical protein